MSDLDKLIECLKEAGYTESKLLTKKELDEITEKTKEIAKQKGW